jgi:hypothetical protein
MNAQAKPLQKSSTLRTLCAQGKDFHLTSHQLHHMKVAQKRISTLSQGRNSDEEQDKAGVNTTSISILSNIKLSENQDGE